MQVQFSHDTKRYLDDKSQNFIVHLTCANGSEKHIEVQDIGIEGDITSITHNTKDCISRIDDETIREINTLAACVKDRHCDCVSVEFIARQIEGWVFETSGQKEPLSQWLEPKISDAIREYRFAFPIQTARYDNGSLHFQATKDVTFETLDTPVLRKFLYENKAFDLSNESVYVCTTIQGEQIYAEKTAFERCSFALDVFKICSELGKNPNCRDWEFDIENGNLQKSKRTLVYWDLNNPDKDVRSINVSLNRFPTILTDSIINSINRFNYQDFLSLYEDCQMPSCSDACKTLRLAIHKYSNALSETDKHERVTSLCSVLDMLVLDGNKSVVASLKKYIPILLEQETDLRDELSKFIGRMYDIRSKYLHHGNSNTKVAWQDVYYLSFIVFNLIHKLSLLRNGYPDLQGVYNAIDKKMNEIIF